MDLHHVAAVLAARSDQWAAAAIEPLGEGDFHVAYLVDHAWVVRFPKHAEATESLRREACLLPKLAARLPLAVPRPEIASLDADPPFVAHRVVPGPELTPERYFALDEADRDRCAAQLAEFLTQLHATDIDLANACGIEVRDHRTHAVAMLRDARLRLWPSLGEPERAFIEATVGEYVDAPPASPRHREPSAVLLHGDLSPDHVMYDPHTNAVTGVIDFGDVFVGDPAWDLLYLYEDYGLDLLGRFLRCFPDPDPAALLRRVHRFWALDLVQWALRCVADGATGPVDGADPVVGGARDELDDALAQLARARVEAGRRLDELLAVCPGP